MSFVAGAGLFARRAGSALERAARRRCRRSLTGRAGRKLRVIASIEEPAVIERILEHLGGDEESVDPAHPRQLKRRRRQSRTPPERDRLF